MELLILIFVGILLILGIIGSVIPILPGPPISFLAILLLFFLTPYKLDIPVLLFLGFIVTFITLLDYILQIYGIRKYGGGEKAMNGGIIGLVIGVFFFPPISLIIGPFIGSYIGAKLDSSNENAIRIAFGSILGLLAGTLLKLVVSIFIFYKAVILFV